MPGVLAAASRCLSFVYAGTPPSAKESVFHRPSFFRIRGESPRQLGPEIPWQRMFPRSPPIHPWGKRLFPAHVGSPFP